MSNSICMTVHSRLNYLKQVLDSVVETCVQPYELVIIEWMADQEIKDYLVQFEANYDGKITIIEKDIPMGHAESFRLAKQIASGDVLIHLDDDTYVPFKGWNKILEDFLISYPDVGLIAPDCPGHHLRLHREGFDETDWVLGACWAITKKEFEEHGDWDPELEYAVEMDHCLKLRMRGKRVGMLRDIHRVHLGENDVNVFGDKQLRGTFKFLKKWNEYFLGYFHYKSPMMLYWDDFPPNQMMRKMIFAQEDHLNKYPFRKVIQGHDCELITIPKQPGIFREDLTREFVLSNLPLSGSDEFDKVERDLLLRKREWGIEDAKKER